MFPFLFVLFAYVGLVAIAALVFPTYPGSFWAVTALLTFVYLAFLLVPSFVPVSHGRRIGAWYLGTFTKTYVTETDYHELKREYGKEKPPPISAPVAAAGAAPSGGPAAASSPATDPSPTVATPAVNEQALETYFYPYVGRGLRWLGLHDVIYLQWPFYRREDVTPATLRIPISATEDIWTVEQTFRRKVTTVGETRVETKTTPNPDGTARTAVTRIPLSKVTTEGEWLRKGSLSAAAGKSEKTEVVDVPNSPGVRQETTTMQTVEEKTTPRVELRVDGEIYIRLGVNLGPLKLTFPDAPLGGPPALGEYLAARITPLIHEAIRDAIGGYMRHEGSPEEGLSWEGEADVIQLRKEVELRVREILGSQRESLLIRSGLLRAWDGHAETSDHGDATVSFDLAIERIGPKEDGLRRAMGAELTAQKEGAATRIKKRAEEDGRTDALTRRRDELGVTGEQVLSHDAVTNTQAGLVIVDTSAANAVLGLTEVRRLTHRGGKGPRKGSKGGPPEKKGGPT